MIGRRLTVTTMQIVWDGAPFDFLGRALRQRHDGLVVVDDSTAPDAEIILEFTVSHRRRHPTTVEFHVAKRGEFVFAPPAGDA